MKNTIKTIENSKLEEILLNIDKDALTIIIDGINVKTWMDYWNTMSKSFSFPALPAYMKPDYHSYYDLMTDLSWIKQEKINIIFKNFSAFLKHDLKLKNDIINDFKDFLLPFWEKEVLETVINGKAKEFCVYTVN